MLFPVSVSSQSWRSRGIPVGPLAGSDGVLVAVVLVQVGDLGHQRIVGVGISQQGADGEEHL